MKRWFLVVLSTLAVFLFFFFFFSSRRRHTRSLCDWSSDVCSSDLGPTAARRSRTLWQKAIAIDERLSVRDSSNREYKLELATFCTNLAGLLHDQIGRASCRERVWVSVGAVGVK